MKGRFPAAFTLTEILTATAVLSLLFTIMFSILQQTSLGWQAANRRVEASQAARLALEQIASDVESCIAVTATQVPLGTLVGGTTASRTTNYAFGFFHSNQPTPGDITTWLGEAGVQISQPNDLLFLVTPYEPSINRRSPSSDGELSPSDLMEVGYLPVFITSSRTVRTMLPGRFVLMRHQPVTNTETARSGSRQIVSMVPLNDFLTNSSNWFTTPPNLGNKTRLPFVDNCIRFDVQFQYRVTNPDGQIRITNSATWGRPTLGGTATNPTARWEGGPGVQGLPLAADITLSVLDERSAERLDRLSRAQNMGRITNAIANDLLAFPTNWASPNAIQRTLMQGAITFQRRVYFRQITRTNL